MPDSSPRPPIATIFFIFFRIGMFSFGGGLSGWVFREVVLRRGWLDEDEFMSGLALCQILPGTNVTNLAVYVGQKLRGWRGAASAFAGLLCVPFFAVIALASVYGLLKALPYADAAIEGVAAAAIGLPLIIIARGARRTARHPTTLLAFLATFAGVGLLHWSLPIVAAVVGAASVYDAWLRNPPRKDDA